MRISILDYNNYEPNEEDINEAADQPGTKLMEKWLNGNTNFWNSFDDDFCDDDELMEIAISQLTLRYENITIHQLYFIISYIGHENEWYGSYAIAMKTMQKEFPTWSSEDLHLLVMKEFPDHVTAAEETSHVNRDGIQGPDDNNNNNVNDNNDDFMKEAGKFPPTEVSSPVNMHNNNPFSASVIRKDEVDVATLDVSSNLDSKYGNNSNGNNINNNYNNNTNNNDNNNNNNNDNNNCKEVDENHNKKNNIEDYDLNGANISSKDSKINNNGISYEDNYNNNDNNDDKNNVRTEEMIVPPIEVSSPVNMHNNNPFSASVIRKDEIVVGGAFAPYFLDPILHFLSSLLLPPSAPPFSLPPFPSTSMAFYLSPCLPPPLLYPLALLYYFNMSVYRTNFPGQLLLKSRVRLALPQNGAA
jgi:hypothetical protein